MTEDRAKEIFLASSYGSAKYTVDEVKEAQEIMWNKIKTTLPKKFSVANSNVAPNFIHALDNSFPSN